MRYLLHRSAGLELWMVDGLGDVEHRRAEDAGALQDGQRFLAGGERLQPGLDDLDQGKAVFRTALIGMETWIGR